jgi:hypothetical protein
MRTIKYIVASLTVAVALFFSGLFYVEYISSGMGFSKLVMRDNIPGVYEEEFRKVQNVLADMGMSSFFMEETETDGIKEISIYADEKEERMLKDSYDVFAGTYRSILSGTLRVRFEPTEVYFQRSHVNPTEYIFVLTDRDLTEELKARGLEIYCKKPESVGHAQLRSITNMILAIAVFLIVFLCLTDVLTHKKEMVVRRILGWDLRIHVLSTYIKDAVTLGSIILFTWLGLYVFHLIPADFSPLCFMFGLVLPADLLFHLFLLHFNVRKNLRRGISHRLMAIHYLLRISSMAVTIAVVAFLFSQMTGLFPVLKMDRKYKCFEGYSIVQPMIFDSTTIYTYDPYDELEVAGELRQLIPPSRVLEFRPDYIRLNEEDNGHEAIMANPTAKEVVMFYLPEYEDYPLDFEKNNYVFYYKPDIEEADLKTRETDGFCERKPEIYLPYTKTVEIQPVPNSADFYMVEDLTQGLYKNPLVFLGDVEPDSFALQNIGLDLTEEELQEYIRQVPKILTYTYTDIYGNYREFSETYRMRLLLFAVLIAALLLLQFCVSFTVISLECSQHALEFALKKIHGFPRRAIYDGMYAAEAAAAVIGAICALVVLGNDRTKLIVPVFVCALLLSAVDYIFMTGRLKKWERENVPKILKGGCL